MHRSDTHVIKCEWVKVEHVVEVPPGNPANKPPPNVKWNSVFNCFSKTSAFRAQGEVKIVWSLINCGWGEGQLGGGKKGGKWKNSKDFMSLVYEQNVEKSVGEIVGLSVRNGFGIIGPESPLVWFIEQEKARSLIEWNMAELGNEHDEHEMQRKRGEPQPSSVTSREGVSSALLHYLEGWFRHWPRF